MHQIKGKQLSEGVCNKTSTNPEKPREADKPPFLKNARFCHGCRALWEHQSASGSLTGSYMPVYDCRLGYKTTIKQTGKFTHLTEPTPFEPCPKPLTHKEYDNCERKK